MCKCFSSVCQCLAYCVSFSNAVSKTISKMWNVQCAEMFLFKTDLFSTTWEILCSAMCENPRTKLKSSVHENYEYITWNGQFERCTAQHKMWKIAMCEVLQALWKIAVQYRPMAVKLLSILEGAIHCKNISLLH